MSENKEPIPAALPPDPCKSFGKTQRLAVLWFGAVIIIGSVMIYNFVKIDRWMFTHNAEVLDYQAYKENRNGVATLPGEQLDSRLSADLTAVEEKLSESTRVSAN